MAAHWRAGLGRLWSSVASRGPVPHRPGFTTSLFAALLAVGVVLGFVAVRASDQSARSALPPATTVPPPVHVTTTSPPTTAPPPVATAPPSTVAATAAPLGPCGRQDLTVTVTVSGGGGITEVESVLRDLAPCSWQPVAVSGRPCPDTIAVESASGQVWPAPGQAEQCSTPAGRVLSPGQVETLSAAWDDRVPSAGGTAAAPAGSYTAVGTWSWAAAGGQPAQATGTEPFSLG
ncbi:MAG: hypothetical protein KGJ77_02345 [Acidobacteriota bacterium]|nr:hypothetical protein [Acidobacteriota bacterium]